MHALIIDYGVNPPPAVHQTTTSVGVPPPLPVTGSNEVIIGAWAGIILGTGVLLVFGAKALRKSLLR